MKRYHELTVKRREFISLLVGKRNFDIRRMDRAYKIDDYIVYKEWCPKKKEYSGNELMMSIACAHGHIRFYAIRKGYVCLGLKFCYNLNNVLVYNPSKQRSGTLLSPTLDVRYFLPRKKAKCIFPIRVQWEGLKRTQIADFESLKFKGVSVRIDNSFKKVEA